MSHESKVVSRCWPVRKLVVVRCFGHTNVVRRRSGDPADTDYTAVGCAVTTISSNLTEMSKGVKLLAALMEDEGANGQQLLGAAKNLASAVSSMLKTAQPANTEVCKDTSL